MKGKGKKMWSEFIYPGLLAILTAILGWIGKKVDDSSKVNNANAKGTMLLLRRQIIRDHRKFVIKGEPMQAFDYDDITEIHDAYKALGGNGLTDKMYKDLMGVDIAEGDIK